MLKQLQRLEKERGKFIIIYYTNNIFRFMFHYFYFFKFVILNSQVLHIFINILNYFVSVTLLNKKQGVVFQLRQMYRHSVGSVCRLTTDLQISKLHGYLIWMVNQDRTSLLNIGKCEIFLKAKNFYR